MEWCWEGGLWGLIALSSSMSWFFGFGSCCLGRLWDAEYGFIDLLCGVIWLDDWYEWNEYSQWAHVYIPKTVPSVKYPDRPIIYYTKKTDKSIAKQKEKKGEKVDVKKRQKEQYRLYPLCKCRSPEPPFQTCLLNGYPRVSIDRTVSVSIVLRRSVEVVKCTHIQARLTKFTSSREHTLLSIHTCVTKQWVVLAMRSTLKMVDSQKAPNQSSSLPTAVGPQREH